MLDYSSALTDFIDHYAAFTDVAMFDRLREDEYGRLDKTEQIYLDYTGGGLHASCQIEAHQHLLDRCVLGNPHSNNPTSKGMTTLVESARRYVLAHFNASADEYLCVFTANATAALKLIGESYQFGSGGQFALTFDNHNSVNGIREFARTKGADVHYVPIVSPTLRVDEQAVHQRWVTADPEQNNLFAYPAQSNFSGVQHPLEWVAKATAAGWDVLLDCAAFAPTNQLDLSVIKPCFAAFSFYKMFGFPTGIGCLLIKKEKMGVLRRPWFSGGTIQIASVQADSHYLHTDEAAFEDGTIDYLNIPAVEIGLRHLDNVGIDAIHEHVMALTEWLLTTLQSLTHTNGRPLIRLLGPTDTIARGGTVTFCVDDVDGITIDDKRIEELANNMHISLRTGCFCNPGAGEIAHHIDAEEIKTFFHSGEAISFKQLRHEMTSRYAKHVSAIRVSMGIASNFSDVYQLIRFLQSLIDQTADTIGKATSEATHCRDTS